MPAELAPIRFDLTPPKDREIQSECGLGAVILTRSGIQAGLDVRKILYQMGMDLQHRAQGSAGMVITDGEKFDKVKDFHWVSVVFQQGQNLPFVEGANLGMLHMRYPTAGQSNHRENIQPFGLDGIWFGHHGNLTNVEEIEKKYGPFPKGGDFPDTDSWVAVNTIVKSEGNSLEEKLINAQKEFEGGWAFIVTDGKKLVASRDPYGIRPLMLGRIGPKDNPWGYVISVETCVFEKIKGFSGYRDIRPGETVLVDQNGEKELEVAPKGLKACSFEHVYMQGPSSVFEGREVMQARENMGRIVWRESPVEVKEGEQFFVIPVPDSARPAAEGLVEEAQKTLGARIKLENKALLKNRYVGRLYIEPSDKRVETRNKYTVIRRLVEGRKIILVDDSIVHGITTQAIVELLLENGAAEVHVRIVSPEIKDHCTFGVDQSGKLFAKEIPGARERAGFLGANSLAHISRQGLAEAIGRPIETLCMSCFDGDGPPKARSVIPLNEFA